ncbi:LOW QUALITY PROTEIN: uncharacterized protein LOC142550185 [Primulina tabacum]|uniref:LOW QUALITY PROTEIN: uncharacterized protein LOC142550185 n=1 Tax=Primulina tabacum TaxID=48773 RepID=UPI003F59A6BA
MPYCPSMEFTIGHRELDRFGPAFALDYFDCYAGSYYRQDLDLHPDEGSPSSSRQEKANYGASVRIIDHITFPTKAAYSIANYRAWARSKQLPFHSHGDRTYWALTEQLEFHRSYFETPFFFPYLTPLQGHSPHPTLGPLQLKKRLLTKGSDPPDGETNSALLLSRRTYPPRDSWNFSPPFGYAGTKSPLTTNQQTSSGWVLPGRSEQEGTPRRHFDSWAAVSRSRGRSAPCPLYWVICSRPFLLQSDLAGERSQFATENKTASERTFVRFFSTKHGSLRITVGRWLPKETPIRSASRRGGIYLIPITRRGSL